MYQDKQYAILEDVFNRECAFLDDRYKWGLYMRENNSVNAVKEELQKTQEELQAKDEALQKAEADKAKAEAELKEAQAEIARWKAIAEAKA